MYIFVVLYAIIIVILPALWLAAWRSKFMLEKHIGMRTEVHREEGLRVARMIGPMWLLMVLAEIGAIIDLFSVSHDFRLFWRGFLLASLLFIIGFMVVNYISVIKQAQEKRRQKPQGENVV